MRTSFALPLLAASFITSMIEAESCSTAEKSLTVAAAKRSYFGDRQAVIFW